MKLATILLLLSTLTWAHESKSLPNRIRSIFHSLFQNDTLQNATTCEPAEFTPARYTSATIRVQVELERFSNRPQLRFNGRTCDKSLLRLISKRLNTDDCDTRIRMQVQADGAPITTADYYTG